MIYPTPPDLDLLEQMADDILYQDRRENRASRQHGYILSLDQWYLRKRRELLTPTGNFDIALTRGIYGRVHAGYPNRPLSRSRYSHYQDPWLQDVYESFWGT
mgnify:CR=1 FL=1